MVNNSDWNASQYLNFARDRTRSAGDLLAQVPLSSPRRIVDLGCGPGNSTELLALRYPNSKLSGMDSSANMLKEARSHLPNVEFELGNLESYMPDEKVDLFFSNAVFQWIPGDERITIIKRLIEPQHSGACFALQMPDVTVEPCHTAIIKTATDKRWQGVFDSHSPIFDPIPTARELHQAFGPLCSKIDIWYTFYEHRLESHQAIVEWFKGSGLRPFLDLLDETRQTEFSALYLGHIKSAYQPLDDGSVLLKMPRLFMVLTKA